MKNLLKAAAIITAVILWVCTASGEKAVSVFRGNMGFDDISQAVETAISQNRVASMVFNREYSGAVQVFAENANEQD